jgi:hypothetical protein
MRLTKDNLHFKAGNESRDIGAHFFCFGETLIFNK